MAETEPTAEATDLEKTREELMGQIRGVESELQRERQAREDAERKAAAPPPEPEPKLQTAEELQGLVDTGVITQAKAHEIISKQESDKVRRQLKQEIEQESQIKTRVDRINGEIVRYREALPEVDQAGTPQRQKLEGEFRRLVDLGYPNDTSTELVALRTCFGEPEGVKERPARPPAAERSGGAQGDRGAPEESEGGGAGVSGRLRSYYQKQIDNGTYSGWDDATLKKELGYAKKSAAA